MQAWGVTAFGLRKLSGPSKFEQPTKMNTPTQIFFSKNLFEEGRKLLQFTKNKRVSLVYKGNWA